MVKFTNVVEQSSNFPIRLLVVGYGSAGLLALLLTLLGGGLLAAVLTFWLGGALATLCWGVAGVYFPEKGHGQRVRAPEVFASSRVAASAE